MARSGWTPEAVQRVIAQQASRAQRRAVADAVLLNQGRTVDELRTEVAALHRRWIDHTA